MNRGMSDVEFLLLVLWGAVIVIVAIAYLNGGL